MSLFWINSTRSGLCDRLIDLFIVSSMAKLYNKNIYLCWYEQPIHEIQKNIWNKIRFNDYKIKNVKKYFIFPEIINIISEEELNNMINNYNNHLNENNMIFDIYLGGIYSPITFYDKFIDKKYSLENYINIFFDLINKFKPRLKLLKLINNLPKNIISIHLRRTDKTTNLFSYIDTSGVALNELEILDSNTKKIINKLLEEKNYYLYFSSDCNNTKILYEEEYKKKLNKKYILNFKNNIKNEIEQTYIDIYIMSISNYIIMSQRHSSFSLFSSLINKNNLIYLYNDSIINKNKYYEFENIKYYDKYIII